MESDSTNNYEAIVHKKIKEMGEKGISQQELAKSVGLPIREISGIIKKLVEKKLVIKKAVKENGKNIVKLFAVDNTYNINIYVNLDSLEDIPCLSCKNLTKCGNGIHVSPQTCGKLSSWILEKTPL
ncbi:winged helix-turn-helix domain-containing protein [Sulfolobus tengchongensis]|uniref:Winged helix-turn-helix domain-containing protein n=1 Tax=Sulfolobus tengchongensis TaxID=207809 RepID=A0AAX4L0X2_9CREN